MKRIIIAYNPVSGRGRASQLATAIASCFVRHPNDVELVPTKQEDPKEWLIPKLKTKPDAVVVVGGDGTLRQVASVLVGTNIPIYHAASGTENLFAKSMNMSSEPEEIALAIELGMTQSIDTATANKQFMLLMGSVGFDADIIARLAASRGSSITHMSYLVPTIKSLLSFHPPTISIEVDGEKLVDHIQGWAIVANSRAYARGLNPAKDARIDDGELDILFLPVRSRLQLLHWVRLLPKGTHVHHPNAIYMRGKEVTVQTTSQVHWQIDGDAAGLFSEMVFKVNAGTLGVLQQTIAVDDSAGDSGN